MMRWLPLRMIFQPPSTISSASYLSQKRSQSSTAFLRMISLLGEMRRELEPLTGRVELRWYGEKSFE